MRTRPERIRLELRKFNEELLADRMADLFPQFAKTRLAEAFATMDDENFNALLAAGFKLCTTINLQWSNKTLAQHGWFSDFGVPAHEIRWAEMLLDERREEAEVELESYFQAKIPALQIELSKAFPERTKLIGNAFDLHRAGNYEAAIPLFLSQTDGITHEKFKCHFFSSDKDRLKLKTILKRANLNWLAAAGLEPVSRIPSIAMTADPGEPQFNRHLVMHGGQLDYGTRRNSLKTISILAYLNGLIRLVALP